MEKIVKETKSEKRKVTRGGAHDVSRNGEFVVSDPTFKPKRFTVNQLREAVRRVNEAQGYKPK